MDVYVCPKLLRGKGTQPGVASGSASPRTVRTAEPEPKQQPTLEDLARRHQPTFEEVARVKRLASSWPAKSATSSAAQAAAQAAAQVARGGPTPTPARLPKSAAADDAAAAVARDDISIDMVAPSRSMGRMGRATCGGSSGKLGLMEHLEAAKQSAKQSAQESAQDSTGKAAAETGAAAVETAAAAVETAAAAVETAAPLTPSRAANLFGLEPPTPLPPTPELSRETRVLLQALVRVRARGRGRGRGRGRVRVG